MGIQATAVVPFPIEETFAWHERRGALQRLVPPWQPLRVQREPDNLRDGRAELRLPGGLVWIAQHRDYQPPHQFADRLSNLPLPWRHTHRFEAVGSEQTRVIDQVDTPVPASALRSTFAYRHRQLADDLAVARAAEQLRPAPLTVAITGSSGLVGTALSALLGVCGHRVIRLVRRATSAPDERPWNPAAPDPAMLAGIDAVVHLAGASIAGRFTDDHRRAIRDSRVEPTRRLAELIAAQPTGPDTLICASAIGYYGPDRGDELLDEDAERGDGFLADVVTAWEGATTPASAAGIRVAHIRTGIVQSPRGGALRLQRPLFAAALGGRLGDGRQWTSWIDLDDLTDIYLRAVLDTALAGPVNAVSPQPVRNEDYTATLARVLRRPALLPVPAAGPRLLLGRQGAREVALAGQLVIPARLTSTGHSLRRPQLEDCLRHQLGHLR
ncbi:MAG: TIGR01777 family oxidoreductase [Jatrophihabitantaceae bacterium]